MRSSNALVLTGIMTLLFLAGLPSRGDAESLTDSFASLAEENRRELALLEEYGEGLLRDGRELFADGELPSLEELAGAEEELAEAYAREEISEERFSLHRRALALRREERIRRFVLGLLGLCGQTGLSEETAAELQIWRDLYVKIGGPSPEDNPRLRGWPEDLLDRLVAQRQVLREADDPRLADWIPWEQGFPRGWLTAEGGGDPGTGTDGPPPAEKRRRQIREAGLTWVVSQRGHSLTDVPRGWIEELGFLRSEDLYRLMVRSAEWETRIMELAEAGRSSAAEFGGPAGRERIQQGILRRAARQWRTSGFLHREPLGYQSSSRGSQGGGS